ncbi:maternal embryonic leucine zipper kinase-like [Periplaneta americana]|uniref:maternal embryonic leucine zipper kinase-like n=1 Tax=Periplaneta americana TaxID=6978 RepID=UPI0037E8A281
MVRYSVLKDHYELEKTIGCGGFAKVKLATHILTGEKVAIKIMNKLNLGDDLPRVKLEIKALKSLSHQHICRLFQVIENETHCFLVMEYCSEGELFDHIVERNKLNEEESRSFFRQIVSAVAYLHSVGYVHRDLKPENVLLDTDQVVKLIDFGLCAKPKGGLNSHLATSCGSPTYAAPELVVGKVYLGAEVDIWSMGVLLYALLCGCLPFDDNNIDRLYRKILSGNYDEPEWLSLGSKQLIRAMLQVDPKKRITMDKLMRHPWVTAGGLGLVIKDSGNLHAIDEECLDVMARHYGRTAADLREELTQWRYDGVTATYLLLVTRKRRGLALRLTAPPRSRLNLGPSTTTCVETTPEGKENRRRGAKRLRSPGLGDESPVPTKQGRCSRTLTPVAATPSRTPTSARKVLGSIERGLTRMRHMLTPRVRDDQPTVLEGRALRNVSTTSSRNPEHVLGQLRHALDSKGIPCKQRGFTLRGKVATPKLSFELEVCLVPVAAMQSPLVGVLRKRLSGDIWCYKRVCEEVLALAAST